MLPVRVREENKTRQYKLRVENTKSGKSQPYPGLSALIIEICNGPKIGCRMDEGPRCRTGGQRLLAFWTSNLC